STLPLKAPIIANNNVQRIRKIKIGIIFAVKKLMVPTNSFFLIRCFAMCPRCFTSPPSFHLPCFDDQVSPCRYQPIHLLPFLRYYIITASVCKSFFLSLLHSNWQTPHILLSY